ncbi:lytic polysaccharide monooxygenase [Photorhabdus sp. P32]|uniref:lytic polysaccharide monooxygenase n=1 Tax=Photorhabdus sp. P32 TaxID=3117549 RepID=UPI00311AFCA3
MYKQHKVKVMTLAATMITALSNSAWAHGYIDSPGSRAFLCSAQGNEQNTDCGLVKYEPQSLEAKKGFPQAGPEDGHIASAGIGHFGALDVQTEDRWKKIPITAGDIEFQWEIVIQHKTASWEYFITKPDWNPNKPLTREQFNSTPFCFEDYQEKMPGSRVINKCILPEGYQGYHVILGVWTISDTLNAFYQVIDTTISPA